MPHVSEAALEVRCGKFNVKKSSMFNLWNGIVSALFLGDMWLNAYPLLVQLLCKSSNILDIDETTNAGDEPAPIEMRFHVKTLLTFASRSCAALKGRLSVR